MTALCVGLCVMARRGDTERPARPGTRPAPSRAGLVVWEKLPELAVRDRGLSSGVRLTVHHDAR